MNNTTTITLLCSTSQTFLEVSQMAYQVTYYGIAVVYVFLGLLGHITALMAFRRQYRTQQAYMYQMVSAINDVLVLLTQSAYVFGHEICAGVDGHGGYIWYKQTYSLMWYEAHVSVPITNAVFTVAVLLALSTTMDRVFALASPIRYKAKNHKRHQALAVTICYLIGLGVNMGDCMLLTIGQWEGHYYVTLNLDYNSSIFSTLTWYSRNLVLVVSIIGLPICNGIMLYLFRKRNTKLGAITGANVAKEAERRSQENALIVLSVSQSLLNFISAGALVAYYGGMLLVPSFLDCYDVLCSPLLDSMQMMADMLQFYLALCLSRQLRKAVAEVFPCLGRCLVSAPTQQGPYFAVNVTPVNSRRTEQGGSRNGDVQIVHM